MKGGFSQSKGDSLRDERRFIGKVKVMFQTQGLLLCVSSLFQTKRDKNIRIEEKSRRVVFSKMVFVCYMNV